MLIQVALLLSVAANPETLTGKVVGVSDGDTLTLLVEKTQYKIRLAGIDAPEKGQAFGNKAKQALSDKVFGKQVQVRTQGQDQYGRTIGVVWLGKRNVNAEMVREGWAWHYKKYDKSKELADAEVEARKSKRGLWADAKPTPPWDWRAAERANKGVAGKPTK